MEKIIKEFLDFLSIKTIENGFVLKSECRKFLSRYGLTRRESNKLLSLLSRFKIVIFKNEKVFLTARYFLFHPHFSNAISSDSLSLLFSKKVLGEKYGKHRPSNYL